MKDMDNTGLSINNASTTYNQRALTPDGLPYETYM